MSTRGEFEPIISSNPYTSSTVIVETPMANEYWGEPAGFWMRLAAWVVDALLVGVLQVGVFLGLAVIAAIFERYKNEVFRTVISDNIVATVILIFFAVSFLYFVLQESSTKQATVGKRLLGLAVIHKEGGRIGFFRALGRWMAHGLSDVLLGIGYLIQPFNQDKQALHDLVSRCVVIQKAPLEQGIKKRSKKYGRSFWLALVLNLLFVSGVGIVGGVIIPNYLRFEEEQDRIREAKQEALIKKLEIESVRSSAAELASELAYRLENNEELPATVEELEIKTPLRVELSIEQSPPTARARIIKNGKLKGLSIWYRVHVDKEQECFTDLPLEYVPKDCSKVN